MLNYICNLLTKLASEDVCFKEYVDTCVVKGGWSESIASSINHLLSVHQNTSLTGCINIELDDDELTLDQYISDKENDHISPEKFKLTFHKNVLCKVLASEPLPLAEVILFTSVEQFKKHSVDSLGLTNPFEHSRINCNESIVIWVYGLAPKQAFGGCKIAVLPCEQLPTNEHWLSSEKLPYDERLKKEIYVVSQEKISISPSNFELSWGEYGDALAKPFRIAFAQVLIACTAQHFFCIDKVTLHGIKLIQASIKADNLDIDISALDVIKKAIDWCYSDNDSETKLQLLTDRISLDLSQDGNLYRHSINHMGDAFEQAKTKYAFVIAERNNDYRKELKEVYDDIRSFSSEYGDKARSLSDGLMKDMLSIAFIFTVGSVAKAIVYKDLLKSQEAHMFFIVIAIYLAISFLSRCCIASSSLSQSKDLLMNWSAKLRTHIPKNEIDSLIKSSLTKPKRHYEYARCLVGVAHTFLIFLCIESDSLVQVFFSP
jgi:hypothetical protein